MWELFGFEILDTIRPSDIENMEGSHSKTFPYIKICHFIFGFELMRKVELSKLGRRLVHVVLGLFNLGRSSKNEVS